LRRAQPYIGRVAGGLVALAGAYVAWYGWLELRLGRSGRVPDSSITDVVAGWSSEATRWIDEIGAVRIAVAVAVLLAAVALAVRGSRARTAGREPASTRCPARAPTAAASGAESLDPPAGRRRGVAPVDEAVVQPPLAALPDLVSLV